MLLKRIRLENFKKFKSIEKELSHGINVIKGSLNETGKSTLLQGIVVALFENPKSSAAKLESLWTWGAGKKSRLYIEFDVNGEYYTLEKNFDSKTLNLTAQNKNKIWNTPRQIEEQLHNLLGVASQEIFLTTCCIRQDEVRQIQSGKEKISQSMERIITGGASGATAEEVRKKLDDAINKQKKGTDRLAKDPGPIAKLRTDIGQKEEELKRSIDAVKELEDLRLELPAVTKRLEQVTKDLDFYQQLLDRDNERQETEEKLKRLREDYDRIYDRISQLDKLEKDIKDVTTALDSLHGFDDEGRVAKIRDKLKELDGKRSNIEEDLPKRRQELANIEARLRQRKVLITLSSRPALSAGIVIAIFGFALTFWSTPALVAGIIGVLLVIASLIARNSIIGIQRDRENLWQRIKAMEKGLEELAQEEVGILAEMDCSSRHEFDKKYQQSNDLRSELQRCRTGYKTLLGGQIREHLEEQKRDLVRKIAVEEERLEKLKSIHLSPEERLKYGRLTQNLDKEKKELERRKLEIEVKLEKPPVDPEHIAQLEEDLQELKQRLQIEERKLKAYELAREFIAKAKVETLRAIHEDLQQNIKSYFCIFTDGKYNEVRLDRDTLECDIFSIEKGDWVKPEELSGGTIDQFYLAYRLAMARVIYRDKQPPLILDDPFYNFDNVRLQRALNTLKEISKNQQVIIFTLGDTYDTIADRIIELPQA